MSSEEGGRIEQLIEQSSLGTAEAKAARESVTPAVGRAIALAARYLGERDQARDIAVALEQRLADLSYAYAATVDGEWGCCHTAEELRRGGREPQFDGDTFEPLPDDCTGLEHLALIDDPEADR